MDNNLAPDDNMLGVYAARRYESLDVISVYVGASIGKTDCRVDNNAGYDKMQDLINQGGGRHIMAIGAELIDGTQDGYTGAQYFNSAYRIAGYVNKAEMLGSGTIRVLKGKTIQKDEEILFAYHDGYWRRWGPTRRRGRPRKQPAAAAAPRPGGQWG